MLKLVQIFCKKTRKKNKQKANLKFITQKTLSLRWLSKERAPLTRSVKSSAQEIMKVHSNPKIKNATMDMVLVITIFWTHGGTCWKRKQSGKILRIYNFNCHRTGWLQSAKLLCNIIAL